MRLDESIELINKKQKLSEMTNTNKLSVSEMRNYIHEMMTNEGMSSCLYEVLMSEGFLPADLNEDEDHDTMCEIMMEDDMVAEEMFKACSKGKGECGSTIKEWFSSKLGGSAQPTDEEIGIYEDPSQQTPEQSPSASNGAFNLDDGSHSENDMRAAFEAGKTQPDFDGWYPTYKSQGSMPSPGDLTARRRMQQADTFGSQVNPEISKEGVEISKLFGNGTKFGIRKGVLGEKQTQYVEIFFQPMDGVRTAIRITKDGSKVMEGHHPEPNIARRLEKFVQKIQSAELSSHFEEGVIKENELPKFTPVKGKNVDTDNKNNAKEDGATEVNDSQKSQETVEQKIDKNKGEKPGGDPLKNQKFSPNMESDFHKEIDGKHLGAFNALNLDFQNDVPQSYKDRVHLEVTTGHSRVRDEATLGKEANVDHEATKRTGEAMIKASQLNQPERDKMYKANPIITEPYEETSVTGTKGGGKGGDLTKKVNEDLEKMKKFFVYEDTQLNENAKKKLNEDDILFKSVSNKKFI